MVGVPAARALAGVPVSERLVRVERFEELREGMIVVVNPCRWCTGTHRHMVMSAPEMEPSEGPEGISEKLSCAVEPPASCDPIAEWRVTPVNGNVFRVLDGLKSPSQVVSTTEKQKETVKP